jgi:HK97 gp10 family phage protein
MMATKLKWFGDKAIQGMEQAVSLALEAAGLLVHGQAVNLSPVGQYPKGSGKVGGNLRNSLSYSVDGEVKGLNSSPGQKARPEDGVKPNPDKNSVIIGTNVEYAPYVELGTSKMTAQPYLNPALEMNKNNIKRIFADALKEALGR